jgi:hypothetical protein
MNVTFTELDNNDSNLDFSNQNPYFNEKLLDKKSQIKTSQNKKVSVNKVQNKVQNKKNISYDDILSSMNTVVVDGKLEFIKNDEQPIIPPMKKVQFSNEIQQHQQQQQPPRQQHQQPPPRQQHQQPPLDPSLKNSYIYNKFFKDYKDPNIIEEQPKIPITREELKKQLIINCVNRYNERNRINQIKSTKLQFNVNSNNVIRPRKSNTNITGINNHLFNFK